MTSLTSQLEKAVQMVIGLKAKNEEYAQRLSILEARNQLLCVLCYAFRLGVSCATANNVAALSFG